ncbi:hypothetical protein TRFO_12974 [Tritrichomonas foetus]|uniref:Uncharacterized protein n=1 Tax=Tritrichomonas foetus TaxID=1144522 RepID=A0A1J4KZN8_9EUKA|nr:hypothetical protein TRFO_12974 [Tritrichomonas foetus]|eukprot:OHT16715.1 hypothetical protein TRFO_12974 [Tritrichomonas foetus]
MPPVVPVTTINSQNVAFNSSQSNKNSKFDISSSSENNHRLISSSLPPDSSPSSQSLSPIQSSNFSINGNTTNKKSDVSHSLAIPGGRLLGNTILDRKRKLNGKSPDQIFEEATHNEKGDTVYLNIIRSAKLYKEAADFGNVEAQYMLGMKFLKGIGVRQDITESFKYFQKCSQNGKAAGTSRLAQISMNYFEDETNSLKYLKEALKGNDLYANFLAVKSFVDGKKWFSLEEAIVSFRFCIRREFLQFSQVFLDFAQNAPKKFIETLDEDSKKDPSALFFIGILLFKSVIDSNSLKVNHNKSFEEVLELSFLKNYRSSFEYFMNHGMNPKLPPSERQNHGCYYIIDGAKAARAGKLAEAVGLWRKASEICCWAPDRESLEMVVKAMTLGKVDKKSVIDLLTVYADNGSGSAQEVFGILLIQGKVVEKNVSRGLFYLKAAYDDINYKMQDYQFLRDNCPGFYCD